MPNPLASCAKISINMQRYSDFLYILRFIN